MEEGHGQFCLVALKCVYAQKFRIWTEEPSSEGMALMGKWAYTRRILYKKPYARFVSPPPSGPREIWTHLCHPGDHVLDHGFDGPEAGDVLARTVPHCEDNFGLFGGLDLE